MLLKELVVQQVSTIESLTGKLAQLEHYIANLVRARHGPRSEKLDPNQLALFDAALEELAAERPPVSETPVEAHVRHGGGRQSLPAHLPAERIEHDLSEAEKCCPGCGQTRHAFGSETSEQLKYVPAELKVVEHVRWKYACRACQEHVAIAAPPPKPIERGLPEAGLLAQLVVGKFSDHLPLYRLEDIFARAGMELPRSTLCRWARQTAELLEPLYALMVQRVCRSHVIHTDDTPVPVLDPTLGHTRTGRFWVYCGDRGNPYSVYDYTPSREARRSGEVPSRVSQLSASRRLRRLRWDLRRRKREASALLGPWPEKVLRGQGDRSRASGRALAWIARLYAIEREAKDATPQARWALRQERALPLLAQFREWLVSLTGRVLPKSPLGQAVQYVLPRWDGFVRYCEDGALAIDNNLSERTLRPCAIGRKNWLFLGNDRGGRTAAILLSFMASAKANQVEPWAYLYSAITQLASQPRDPQPSGTLLAELLPDTWLRAHPEAHRPWSR